MVCPKPYLYVFRELIFFVVNRMRVSQPRPTVFREKSCGDEVEGFKPCAADSKRNYCSKYCKGISNNIIPFIILFSS